MVTSNLGGQDWTMDETGKIRFVPLPDSEPARAMGWVDAKRFIGGVEKIEGENAMIELLPTEVLDLLEQRFPGTRWFIGSVRSSAA